MIDDNEEQTMNEDDVEVNVAEDEQDQKTTDQEQSPSDEQPIEVAETNEEEEEKPRPSKFQKRIDDLTRKQKEAERQRDEYYRVANQVLEENKTLRNKATQFGKFGSEEFSQRVDSQIAKAKADYKTAYEGGDADAIIEAQQRLIDATTAKQKVGQVKQATEQVAQQQQINLVPPPNSKAVDWASKNSWFNKDMVMTNAAYTVHDELMKQGVQADTDEYYNALDARLKNEFPHKFSSAPTEKPREKPPVTNVVTPAGNNVSNRSRKVRLSPSQVAVANRLGVPLEDYAKEFVALNKG